MESFKNATEIYERVGLYAFLIGLPIGLVALMSGILQASNSSLLINFVLIFCVAGIVSLVSIGATMAIEPFLKARKLDASSNENPLI